MRRTKHQTSRLGTAAAETAIVLPLVVVVMLGSVEVCGGIHQQYRLRGVLHECSKFAAKGETTSPEFAARAQTLMNSMEFTNYTMELNVVPRTVNTGSVEPAPITSFTFTSSGSGTAGLEDIPRGTLLRMSVTADRPSIGVGLTRYMGSTIESQCVFVKEI